MRALDSFLAQARLLRIARAQRAQAAIMSAGSTDVLPVAGAPVAVAADWIAECATSHGILAALASRDVPEDPRRTRVLGVLDMSVLQPFIDAAVAATLALIEEHRPQDAVFASMWPAVCAHAAPFAVPDPETVDAGRVRRAAVMDVAMLAVEDSLFEVLRAVIETHDAKRTVAVRPDLDPIVIEPGRVRRVPRSSAGGGGGRERRDQAARGAVVATLSTSVSDLTAKGAFPKVAKPPTRAVLRAQARERRLAREAAARSAASEVAQASDIDAPLEPIQASGVIQASEPIQASPLETVTEAAVVSAHDASLLAEVMASEPPAGAIAGPVPGAGDGMSLGDVTNAGDVMTTAGGSP